MTQIDRTKTPLAMGAKKCADTEDQEAMWVIDEQGKGIKRKRFYLNKKNFNLFLNRRRLSKNQIFV
jgi:hypothetical protein